MLVQWMLTIALTGQIILGATQGFLLLAKLHQAHSALAHEQEQIRFLVSYFRSILHGALMPGQVCGEVIAEDNPLSGMKKRHDSILDVMMCYQNGRHSGVIAQQFFLLEAENKRGLTLFVQEGDHRREALSSGLQILSLKFCTKISTDIDCRPAKAIQDWSEVGAVEFTLQFLPNFAMDKVGYTTQSSSMAVYCKTGRDYLRYNQESGHALIVVLVFLMLSSILLQSTLETLKHDRLSIHDFESSITNTTIK